MKVSFRTAFFISTHLKVKKNNQAKKIYQKFYKLFSTLAVFVRLFIKGVSSKCKGRLMGVSREL